MTKPDASRRRKPRRLGLYAPFVLALVLLAGWSAFWLYARSEAARRIDQASADLRKRGYEVSWTERRITGWPYRLRITLTEASLREPSGWALASPEIAAETYLHALDRWMINADRGLTFTRPVGGPVAVTGTRIRASLGGLDRAPPRIAFEGAGLTFTPAPGAQPYPISAAKRVDFEVRPGPDDQGAVLLKVDGASARLAGLLARIAGEAPIGITWEATLSKMSAFTGPDWPSAVRSWTAAGGKMSLRNAGMTAGEAVIGARKGELSVGGDGRLRGSVDASLRQAPKALAAMGETGVISPEAAGAASAVAEARQTAGELARANISFEAGQTTLGPVRVGPAPRVY
jgi:hypothetical protein